MKFKTLYTNNPLNPKQLFYRQEDYSFDVEPLTQWIDFDITINKLCLTVVNKRIIQIWGYCPYDTWIDSNYKVPAYKSGMLEIINDLEAGFTWSLDNTNWPIYVNKQTGWICVGNPEVTSENVEFMNHCVAVVRDNQLVALWLKPDKLPDFNK